MKLRALIVNVLAALVLFALWCVADYFGVKSPDYPANIHRFSGLVWFYPLVPLTTNLILLRKLPDPKRSLCAVALSVASCFLAILFVLFFGIPFHFSIGGHL